MAGDNRRARALFISSSLGVLTTLTALNPASLAGAQTGAQAGQQALPPVTVEAPTERRPAASKPKPAAKPARAARRRTAPEKPPVSREPTTDVATRTTEPVIASLAAVSVLRPEQINWAQAGRVSDLFNGMPGVWFADRGDDPGSAINIRGLQDFGRVAVVVDGATQDFQRSGHFANGQFYLDPELLGGVDVVRGPVANIYGSGAIGGVASFRTKDLSDILLPGEWAAVQTHGTYGTNAASGSLRLHGARGAAGDIFAGGVFRDSHDYQEGNGSFVPHRR